MTGKLRDILSVPLSTTQVGQFPKPSWYRYSIEDADFTRLATNHEFLEAYEDASKVIIMEQENAGLDIITDGGLRFDRTSPKTERVASWSTNNLAYMAGVRPVKARADDKAVMESVITREIVKAAYELPGGRYPLPEGLRWVVEGDIDVGRLGNWVEAFKIAQSSTKKPLKFSGPSAGMATVFSVNKSGRSDRDVYFDFFRVQNKVLRELVKAGCKLIQLDYPFGLLHWAANKAKVREEIWHDAIEAANEEIKGVDAHIWYHFCFGAPVLWGYKATPLRYSITETYRHMGESKCDLLQSEAANTRGEYLDQELAAWNEHCSEKEVGVGIVSPYIGVETAEDADRIVQKALKHVPPDKLALTSDEGLSAHGMVPREIAIDKMKLIVTAGQTARKQL